MLSYKALATIGYETTIAVFVHPCCSFVVSLCITSCLIIIIINSQLVNTTCWQIIVEKYKTRKQCLSFAPFIYFIYSLNQAVEHTNTHRNQTDSKKLTKQLFYKQQLSQTTIRISSRLDHTACWLVYVHVPTRSCHHHKFTTVIPTT